MLKKILIILLVILLVASLGFGAWWFFLRPTPLKGTVENSHKVTLNIKDNIYYDVLVPNEAELVRSDEHYVYEYDLLVFGVQSIEPVEVDYKVQIEGRWVWAQSDKDWLLPVAYSMEHNKPYTVEHQFPYLTKLNEETGVEEEMDWATGPAPVANREPELLEPDSLIYGIGDYVTYTEEYNMWDKACDMALDRLAQATGKDSPEYFNNGKCFFAQQDDYCVGVNYINFNTQYAVFARGPSGCEEAQAILVKGVK